MSDETLKRPSSPGSDNLHTLKLQKTNSNNTTMPSAVSNGAAAANIVGGNPVARPRLSKPLVYSGSLDSFKSADVTPVIGREYEGLQVVDLLKADDQVIRDLAVTSKYCQTRFRTRK